MPKLRLTLPLTAVLAVLVVLAGGTGGAAAASKGKAPCWKAVLQDEYVPPISGNYQLHCYKDAIRHLPQDSLIYGAARQDIINAMNSAVRRLRAKGVKVGPHTVLPGQKGPGSRTLQGHKRKKGWLAAIADKIGPGNASSIPLPLLILAGLGLLLVAAAGASFTARWIAARRNAPPHPATSPPTPRRK
jgi:hypothetical protein